jgi:hypothetical protein
MQGRQRKGEEREGQEGLQEIESTFGRNGQLSVYRGLSGKLALLLFCSSVFVSAFQGFHGQGNRPESSKDWVC